MAADKSQIRQWPFAGVSWCAPRPVVKPVSAVATMLAGIPCKLAWRSSSLATTTTSSFSLFGAARCVRRPWPPQPALHVLPAPLRVLLCCVHVRMLGAGACPCHNLAEMHAHCAYCLSSLGAQAAFDKGHYRVRAFGGVFDSAVVKEAQTLASCVLCWCLDGTCCTVYHYSIMARVNVSLDRICVSC